MCGIAGVWQTNGRALNLDRLARMSEAQRHRGPDAETLFCDGRVALINQRLAILDPAEGDQPFVSVDGQVALVQNGEIFNFVELVAELRQLGWSFRTSCDTEVLLAAYEQWGKEFVTRLNGMFAIAIWDGRQKKLLLFRDRIGIKPLYIHRSNQFLAFASELKSFFAFGIEPRCNWQAIDLFLTFNYIPPPQTAFEGIEHLPPGCMATINSEGSINISRWWSLTDREMVARPEAAWRKDFLELLEDAVRLRLRSDVPFGAFLSGGVDSTSVVCFMSRQLREPVQTFSIGFEEPRFDESEYARMAAERFGTQHTQETVAPDMTADWPRVLWHLDQPHGDVSFMPTLRVATLAGRHVKMVLTGDGGDELFAGYDKYRDFFSQRPDGETPDQFAAAYLDNISLFDSACKRSLYKQDFAAQIEMGMGREILDAKLRAASHWDRLNQALNVDMQLLLPGNNLVKPDRMGMAVGVEARTPLLDYRVMELAFTMPGNLKLRDGETKYLFKKAVAPLIGDDLAYRKKQMFTVPIGEWLKAEMGAEARALLLGNRTFVGELFEAAAVRSLIDDHQDERANNTREIRALMALELWARQFFPTDFGSEITMADAA